ncbi:FMN-binding glutamate synthase family protein [Idiomarina xiamenensis]|uniref:Glutamate synthase n=1 Tax=Idiomarina xiamenensis 10-D-4 TaxID=740709 RepID=K2K5M9_9GAMM|nr:FMN-binding glutamate synthase family protein [Idiomarina xiamenensis]EKE82913.1 glutamate synthase [Idiomarina xiamenensis 10-D-4]
MRKSALYLSLIVTILAAIGSYYNYHIGWLLLISIPVLVIAFSDRLQKSHSLLRNYPFFAHARWLTEAIRPYFRQYLMESETSGRPISRMYRSIVYQRAKNSLDTIPFGTKVDTNRVGYEWIGHSITAHSPKEDPHHNRVQVGNQQCQQPYSASLLNISAMSFGALSNNAIRALNKGAKMGSFYHNTGEGGLSDYHLEHGGDVVWQIGTGYFGCRNKDGNFDAESFKEKAQLDAVKMVEIKLSQGAKPGHGGILPAAKNTQEIARIRQVPEGTDVLSPPSHTAFSTPQGLLEFVQQLRDLSGGKPVGFKLCVGNKSEFIAICKAMRERQIYPDFITVDGGEGGTGAAPLEYSNSIGMPLRDALVFVDDCLRGFDLREHVKIIASGKIFTAFHIVKYIALGADLCNSARGMMFALGCVQSLTCNTNRCPTGVATQDPRLAKGLVVSDKSVRVKNFHEKTVKATNELLSSVGLHSVTEVKRKHIFRRVTASTVLRFDEIYPVQAAGCFLRDEIPDKYRLYYDEAQADSFAPLEVSA